MPSSYPISSNAISYPITLADSPAYTSPPTFTSMGNRSILTNRALSLLCSVRCPGDISLGTYDLAVALRDAGVPVVSSFHSPIEQECLCLLLRDVVSLFQLDLYVPETAQLFLQPVDVRAAKLAHRAGIVPAKATHAEIQHAMVALSRERGCSPLLFNQGAWYIGYYSFSLPLELLEKRGID